jgi:hypothetical protein
MEKTRNDCYVVYPFKREPGHEANLHGERAEARSDSRLKMRGARPRRARDGWAAPRGEVAMDAPASLTIDPINILGEEGGRLKRCRGAIIDQQFGIARSYNISIHHLFPSLYRQTCHSVSTGKVLR